MWTSDSTVLDNVVSTDNAQLYRAIFPFMATDYPPDVPTVEPKNDYLTALEEAAKRNEADEAKRKAAEAAAKVSKIEKLSDDALIRLLSNPGTSDGALVQAARVGLERVYAAKYRKEIDERLKALEQATAVNNADDSELPPHLRRRK